MWERYPLGLPTFYQKTSLLYILVYIWPRNGVSSFGVIAHSSNNSCLNTQESWYLARETANHLAYHGINLLLTYNDICIIFLLGCRIKAITCGFDPHDRRSIRRIPATI